MWQLYFRGSRLISSFRSQRPGDESRVSWCHGGGHLVIQDPLYLSAQMIGVIFLALEVLLRLQLEPIRSLQIATPQPQTPMGSREMHRQRDLLSVSFVAKLENVAA